MNTARNLLAAQGTQTAGFVAGGSIGPPSHSNAKHEQWDGTSWTETTDLNTARYRVAGSGTQTSGLVFGGTTYPSPPTGKTEFWNGTSWTELNDMSTARAVGGSGTPAGSSAAAYVTGSSDPGYSAATEEWTASLTNKTITSS